MAKLTIFHQELFEPEQNIEEQFNWTGMADASIEFGGMDPQRHGLNALKPSDYGIQTAPNGFCRFLERLISE